MMQDNNVKTFDFLPPAWDRIYRRSDQAQPFQITINNFVVPGSFLKGNSEKLQCELRFTLFDVTYKQFFGNTLSGCKADIGVSSPSKQISVKFDKSIYLHTSFVDQNIVVAIEFIISDSTQLVFSGWTFFKIFQHDAEIMQDVSHSTSPPSTKLDLYQGSPRALLFLDEPLESNKHLQKILECRLEYKLMTHVALLKILHIIPENTLVYGHQAIPGLIKDPKSNDVLKKIKVDKGKMLNLDKVYLMLDNVEKFEDELCQLMNEDRLHREHSSPDGSELTVIERRLQVGVHNGWSYVQEPQIHHLVPDSIVSTNGLRPTFKPEHHRSSSIISKISSSSTSLVLRNKISLTEVPEKCFVVFLLEYMLSFPMPAIDHRRPSSTTSVGRGSTMAVAVAWSSWPVPKSITNTDVNLTFYGGPANNVESLLLYRNSLGNDSNAIKINFQCSVPDKFSSSDNDGGELVVPASDEEATSLQSEIPIPRKRPMSAAAITKEHRKSIVPRSPVKQSHISSPSKQQLRNKHEERMAEVSHSSTPHLPIIPVVNEKGSAASGVHHMSRAGYAHLYSIGLPTILDRHGKAPHVVDYYDQRHISIDVENNDPLKSNEIIIEFLALSGCDSFFNGQLVYFTFQFYRFAPIKTNTFYLERAANNVSNDESFPFVLYKTNGHGSKKEPADAGFRVTFDVNTQFLFDDDENKVFIKYLNNVDMFVDIWDAQSLFHIGKTSVALKHLCRQGKSAIQVVCELDVTKEDLAPSNVPKCIFHARLANIGRPFDPIALKDKLNNSINKTAKTQVYRSLIEEDRQLMDIIKCYSFSENAEPSEDRKRKIARMNAVRAKKGITPVTQSHLVEGYENKMKMLQIIDEYREKHKDEVIRNVLCKSISYDYSVHAVLGSGHVVLHNMLNNTDQAQTVLIQSQSPLIRVICNYGEWLHVKETHSFLVNLEQDMFSNENSQYKVFLHPNEKIIVPFAYQQTTIPQEITSRLMDPPKSLTTEPNKIKVTMKNASSGNIISIVNFTIRPQPISFDQSVTLTHPSNSALKTALQVPSHICGHLNVRCSDENVICKIEVADNTAVHLKVNGCSADTMKTFFVFLYADDYMMASVFCWRVVVHFIQKIDVCVTQGQTCRTSIVLRGQHSTKSVKVCSSDPKAMAIEPAQSFILPSGAMQEIHLGIRVMQAGSRYLQVNVVDEQNLQLFKAWLVHVRTEQQSVSKAFQVNLPVGGAKAAKKRIKFTNPYLVKKEFTVQTNRADLLMIKDLKLELEGGESYSLSLYFNPSQSKMTVDVLVFINNTKDENEETFCIRTVFS